jgi:hypothetical protein
MVIFTQMMNSRLRSAAALRFAERRQRENDAPRLHDAAPSVATLRLDVTERRGETSAYPRHSRIVVVDSAPALFWLPCSDHGCREGGHDMTTAILRGLVARAPRFELEDVCYGNIGTAQCGLVMHVTVTATYR